MSVTNIVVTEENIVLPPKWKHLEHLLPITKLASIEFDLEANTSFANALRRVPLGEMEAKYLVVTEQDIVTTDELIDKQPLVIVVGNIPIPQSCRVGDVYRLQAVNMSYRPEIVNARKFTNIATGEPLGCDRYRLAALPPGKEITITAKVGVISRHANACLAHNIGYKILDVAHIDAYHANDIVTILTDFDKISSVLGKSPVGRRVLVICEDATLPDISVYDDVVDVNDFKKHYGSFKALYKSTCEVYPRKFHLSFGTYGTIAPKALMVGIADHMLGRLKADFTAMKSTVQGATRYTIPHETYTITVFIAQTAFELGYKIVARKDHPSIDEIYLDVVGEDPDKILTTTIKKCIEITENFRKHFMK